MWIFDDTLYIDLPLINMPGIGGNQLWAWSMNIIKIIWQKKLNQIFSSTFDFLTWSFRYSWIIFEFFLIFMINRSSMFFFKLRVASIHGTCLYLQTSLSVVSVEHGTYIDIFKHSLYSWYPWYMLIFANILFIRDKCWCLTMFPLS